MVNPLARSDHRVNYSRGGRPKIELHMGVLRISEDPSAFITFESADAAQVARQPHNLQSL